MRKFHRLEKTEEVAGWERSMRYIVLYYSVEKNNAPPANKALICMLGGSKFQNFSFLNFFAHTGAAVKVNKRLPNMSLHIIPVPVINRCSSCVPSYPG